jgi:hypothetical protein
MKHPRTFYNRPDLRAAVGIVLMSGISKEDFDSLLQLALSSRNGLSDDERRFLSLLSAHPKGLAAERVPEWNGDQRLNDLNYKLDKYFAEAYRGNFSPYRLRVHYQGTTYQLEISSNTRPWLSKSRPVYSIATLNEPAPAIPVIDAKSRRIRRHRKVTVFLCHSQRDKRAVRSIHAAGLSFQVRPHQRWLRPQGN